MDNSLDWVPAKVLFAFGTSRHSATSPSLKVTLVLSTASPFQRMGTSPTPAVPLTQRRYYVATGADDCTVRLWDLRKLSNPDTLTLPSGSKVSLKSNSNI